MSQDGESMDVARGVFALLSRYGVQLPGDGWAELAQVLGHGDRLGELLVTDQPQNRASRRASAKRARQILSASDEKRAAGERRGDGDKQGNYGKNEPRGMGKI